MTLEEFITKHEGSVNYAYQDSLGYWTIGVGRLIDRRKGGSLSPEEIKMLLSHDIERCQGNLDRNIQWWRLHSEKRQWVLIDMCFNLGIGGLLKFKRMLVHLRNGNCDAAAEEMLKSKWATQVKGRATELAQMMRDG